MRHSRRTVLGAGIGLTGAALLSPFKGRAADVRFTDDPFTLGVASGYPEPNAVVLWTRLAPQTLVPGGGVPPAAVEVAWEVATDERFRAIARRGSTFATPEWAHSVHVEVTGLEPARDYWYRFMSGGQQSAVGRTRTAAARGTLPQRFTLAVASCQHYEQSYFAAYRAVAADTPDVVVHVGDYIYENRGTVRMRTHDQPECYTLDDYRLRYALYKSDRHLKAAHAAAPWLLVSDDHEVANDYAGEHSYQGDPPEVFLARRAAAYQAWYEHQPFPRRFMSVAGQQRSYTNRTFGDLVTLFMLDGRQYRSPQACQPGPLVEPCPELYSEARTMLGEEQERWLATTLGASTARWTLFGQQTLFAHFDQSGDGPLAYWADGWNGYPQARARLLEDLAQRKTSNPVILSGDIHSFLVNDVTARPEDPESPIVATELVTTSISSIGPPQSSFDRWRTENPNVRFARSDQRGYLRVTIRPEQLGADLVAVDDVTREDSGVHVLASFDINNGEPGVAR
jgi:alkaline phosphatase D